jgi:glycosyltransferase involved in cell wall biosynthesis
MRILLLSAYDAVSHRQWRKGLVAALPEHDWTVLTLPPRHFRWRIRGNSLSWGVAERVRLSQKYDCLVATSMVDLAALRGMVPALAPLPALLYFHENQFDYPLSQSAHASIEPEIVNLYSALAAQRLVFNSDYNQRSFLAGVRALLKKMPDAVPGGIPEQLAAKATVLPVPLANDWFEAARADKPTELTIVWNHRWEYDKAPEIFFQALRLLLGKNIPFRVHVLGQAFRTVPTLFDEMRVVLRNQLGQWGRVEDREAYRQLLRQAHVVVSTARHDFQGLAVLEAVAAGCIPVVPDRLAYPEWFTAGYRYASIPENSEREAQQLADKLATLALQLENNLLPPAPDVSFLSWSALQQSYGALINELELLHRDN